MPQAAAGMRIEPPVSVPIVASAMPAATLAADPPLEPPGDRVGSCWMTGGTEGGFLVGRAERELVEIGLPDQHGPGFPQGHDHRRVVAGDVPLAHAGRGGGRRPGDIDQVLDGDRDAVQRTAIASGRELAIGLARLLPCGRRP